MTKNLLALALALLASVPAYAQTEIILDNGSAAFTTTGTWPTSTVVAGFVGSNYQFHAANGAPPSAIVVDNTDPGFSVTGTWPASTAISGYLGSNYRHHFANGEPPSAIVADNSSGSFTGTWPTSTSVGGYYATNYQTHAAGTGTTSFTWTLNVASAGTYEVYGRWTQHANRATNAKYTVNHAGGSDLVSVNQMAGGGAWSLLGTYSFNAGTAAVSVTDQADGYVIADAVMFLPPGASANTATWTPNVAQAGQYEVYARWTQHANRATNASYTVTHANGSTAVPVDQQANGGAWNLLGTYTLAPGTAHNVTLTDQANGYVIADALRLVPVVIQAELKLYFVHTDHLNTPRLVTDANQQTVWKWDQQEPFGSNPADENPSGLGAFDLPLRLPGQRYDKETGLHQNYFRDYDPSLGRYLESDPLGVLTTGTPTPTTRVNYVFAYANATPLNTTDSSGLHAGQPYGSSSCGADDGMRFPSNFGGWSFEQACRNHDNCYSICRKPKGDCDIEFLGDMQKECTRIPIWLAIIARQGQACRATATEYYLAVLIRGGDAYNKAQAKCKGCQ